MLRTFLTHVSVTTRKDNSIDFECFANLAPRHIYAIVSGASVIVGVSTGREPELEPEPDPELELELELESESELLFDWSCLGVPVAFFDIEEEECF